MSKYRQIQVYNFDLKVGMKANVIRYGFFDIKTGIYNTPISDFDFEI